MPVLTIFQHRASLESISCSEQQCFYCTSEFHKVYPLKLGNMLLQPNFLLLIQLLLTLLEVFDQLKQRLTFKRLITTSSLSTNLLLLQTCIQSSSLVESHDGCSHFLYGPGNLEDISDQVFSLVPVDTGCPRITLQHLQTGQETNVLICYVVV